MLQTFMARDPGEVRFTMVVLAADDGEDDADTEDEEGEEESNSTEPISNTAIPAPA